MSFCLPIVGAIAASLLSLLFSVLLYSLRDLSRARLADFLGRRDADHWFEPIVDHTSDLGFLTAIGRQLCNITMWLAVFAAFEETHYPAWFRYSMTVLVAGIVAVFCSITIPHAAARYASAQIVGVFAPFLNVLRLMFWPVTALMHGTDNIVRRALGARDNRADEQIEQEILSAIEEGEKEGVVDEQEREIIESVIEFGETTAGQIMTNKQEIAAVPADSDLATIRRMIDESGHSRIPVYDGTLDHIVGIIYGRDLIKYVGLPMDHFDTRGMMRPPIFAPETKLVRDLLRDFRVQKVHIAIILDEYGGTAGVVTIEDVLEELVGEISDEHEPTEPAMLKRLDEKTVDVDARMEIDELNRVLGLHIAEDAGFDTLAGFLISGLGKIPEKGTVYQQDGARFTVLDAEPQRVKRVKIEIMAGREVGA